ncbi:hypothetical protein JCM9743_15830 [Natrinema sp. JCM 9743]
MFVCHCWSARLVGFDPLADARLGRAVLTTVLAAVPIVALSTAISNPWLALAVVPPAGFVIVVTFVLLVGALDPAEPFEVLSLAPNPIGSRAATIRVSLEDDGGEREVGSKACCSSPACRCSSPDSR